ncbi:MAG TPA: hypothetical protein VFV50_06840 [Bdellovibrionales bacterium]|nr:hypothetical protein [Bdellovibrionales bacterium]
MVPQPKKKNSGGAAVENTVVLALLVTLVSGLFLVLYLSFAKVWTKSALYDGLICVQEGRAPATCDRNVRQRLQYLPWGRIRSLELGSDGAGRATLSVHDEIPMTVDQTLPEQLR